MKVEKELGFLPKGFDLEPDLLDQLSNRSGTQRCLTGHDELLLIVHEVPQPKVPEREARVFWRTPAGGWFGPDGTQGLGALSSLLERYQAAIDAHEAGIDEVETAEELFKIIRHAGPVARSMRNLAAALDHAVLQDEDNRELRSLRDRARESERAAELLYHDAKLTLDFWQAEAAEDQQEASEQLNKIAFRLNLMAGFFLPLVALGGLLGMNIDLPGFVRPMFWGVFAVGLVLGLAVLALVGFTPRKRK